MDEFEFINHIKDNKYRQSTLIKGIGDDAAVFRTNEDIVIATDMMANHIHFSLGIMDPFHIGYRALAANISDIAAMGAIPKFYLVSIAIPKNISLDTVHGIYDGMKSIASQFKLDLIGGDTVSGQELLISITIIGYGRRERHCYRTNSEENDVVFVSGTLGDSRAGLELLSNPVLENSEKDYFVNRHKMPSPRVSLGNLLSQLDRVSLNDVSDGIANELHEIAVDSNVDMMIDDELIPIHHGLKMFNKEDQFNWKYFGGEDFELIGTTGIHNVPKLKDFAIKLNLPITIIGSVQPKSHKSESTVFLKKDNKVTPLLQKGYTHLK